MLRVDTFGRRHAAYVALLFDRENPEEFQRRLEPLDFRPNSCSLVLKQDGDIVGFGGLNWYEIPSKVLMGRVEDLVVADEFYDEGISAMLSAIDERAQRIRLAQLKTEADSRATDIFKCHGFVEKLVDGVAEAAFSKDIDDRLIIEAVSSGVRVRAFDHRDAQEAARLVRQLTKNILDPENLPLRLAGLCQESNSHWVVAEMNKTVVGFGGMAYYETAQGRIGRVEEVVTDQPYRGKGIAKLVTRALIEEARRRGIVQLWLETATAKRVYEACGFVERIEKKSLVRKYY